MLSKSVNFKADPPPNSREFGGGSTLFFSEDFKIELETQNFFWPEILRIRTQKKFWGRGGPPMAEISADFGFEIFDFLPKMTFLDQNVLNFTLIGLHCPQYFFL